MLVLLAPRYFRLIDTVSLLSYLVVRAQLRIDISIDAIAVYKGIRPSLSDMLRIQAAQLAIALEPIDQITLDCVYLCDSSEKLRMAYVDGARRQVVGVALDQHDPLRLRRDHGIYD